jgi:hypothetical protein
MAAKQRTASTPRRATAAKGKTKPRKIVQCNGRPYALPCLFDCGPEKSALSLEIYCQSAIKAAWAAGDHGRMKAARERLADSHLTPATIAAIARALSDYNRKVPWPAHGSNADRKIEWLSTGSGCTKRFGTVYESHLAAWSALSAALSIIADVPLEREEDAEAFFETLTYTGWRHLPMHRRPCVARRMARFVTDRIMGLPFVPTAGREH